MLFSIQGYTTTKFIYISCTLLLLTHVLLIFQQATASSFSYSSAGDHSHSREEHHDGSGEVTGQYSYITPEGQSITVRYRAGVNGFEILNPEEVYPQSF